MRKILIFVMAIFMIGLCAFPVNEAVPSKIRNIDSVNLRDVIGGYAWDVAIVDSELQLGPLTVSTNDGSLSGIKEDSEQFIAGADWYNAQWVGCQYETNALVSIDPVTGEKTVLGTMNLPENTVSTGLAYQITTGNFFVSAFNTVSESSLLYSLDFDTAVVTEIGIISDSHMVIGIASDNEGVIYGIDTFDDILMNISPTDASFTTIGALGVGINYAQDIAYDRDQNKLYGTLYNLNSGTFHEIDTTTGAATEIAAYGDEITGFAIPYSCEEQFTLIGTIINSDTNAGVENANVQAGCYTTTTDEAGSFSIEVNPGTYTLRITADGFTELIQANNVVTADTDLAGIALNPIEALEAPTNLTYSIMGQNATINWDASTSTISEYIIYRDHVQVATTAELTYIDENLSNGYHLYYISSSDGDNSESEYSLDISVRIGESVDAPSELSSDYDASENQVTLNWNAPEQNILFESFENEFPPNGWTRIQENQNEGKFWTQFETVEWGSIGVVPTDGQFQAGVKWGNQGQDEWLITPEVIAQGELTFDFYGKYGSTNNDHYYVKVSTDKGVTWTELWDASNLGGENTYTMPVSIDLSAYEGELIKLAWHIIDGDNQGAWHSTFIDRVNIGAAASRALTGYKVYRNNEELTQLEASATTYQDQGLEAGEQYSYHVTAMYGTQESSSSNSVDVSIVSSEEVCEVLSGISNYPNPFNPNTTISFSLNSSADVNVSVYNTKGQLVKTLVNSDLAAGNHSYNWNGVDEQNRSVGSGLYLYKVKTANSETIKKMLLVK